mmetsp:Transcript_43759/g.133164  ORF Transcript_43759/g.133164 Transcript_43759/m.133164 type:complete len:252 (+) Transcript_43759:1838-2593(+)
MDVRGSGRRRAGRARGRSAQGKEGRQGTRGYGRALTALELRAGPNIHYSATAVAFLVGAVLPLSDFSHVGVSTHRVVGTDQPRRLVDVPRPRVLRTLALRTAFRVGAVPLVPQRRRSRPPPPPLGPFARRRPPFPFPFPFRLALGILPIAGVQVGESHDAGGGDHGRGDHGRMHDVVRSGDGSGVGIDGFRRVVGVVRVGDAAPAAVVPAALRPAHGAALLAPPPLTPTPLRTHGAREIATGEPATAMGTK